MSVIELDSEDNLSDDDNNDDVKINDELVDAEYDINDEYDDDFDNTSHIISLIGAIMGYNVHNDLNIRSVDIPSNYFVKVAMNYNPDFSMKSNVSTALISDSILTYLRTGPLIPRKPRLNNFYFPFINDCMSTDSEKRSLSDSELYVGNLPYDTKWEVLKNWFITRGYGVSRVELKKNIKKAHYAFVRFDSIKTAMQVQYDYEKKNQAFIFKGKLLNIKEKLNKPNQQPKNVSPAITNDNQISRFKFIDILDIHCGTIITGAAMKNIRTEMSNVSDGDKYGIIAHRLMEAHYTRFHLKFDIAKKKLAISGSFDLDRDDLDYCSTYTILEFEWDFRDIKARKMTPVLINQNEIYLLFEVKRSPTILQKNITSTPLGDAFEEKRLPGWGVIGSANAWLCKLSSKQMRRDYIELFTILRRYNLSRKEFSERNIIPLIETIEVARKNLESVALISSDEWIQKNQATIDNFLTRRWPCYPFETKFEIMKLISKHIITVHDLIIDEQAEHILKLCSINTLIALTDKIVELAPRWLANTCDNEGEDCGDDNEQNPEEMEQSELQILKTTQDLSISTENRFAPKNVRSCSSGQSIDAIHTEIACVEKDMENLSLSRKRYRVGTFSRLLILAFEQLFKKFQLCRTNTTGTYVTKLELRTANADSFSIHKIYITPSTILHEGPYREEKCAVTREFVKHQDRFLRVTFRDEDYRVLHNYNDNMTRIYERIKTTLIKGIDVCDRHYEFLAFSSSQLREHSCWMFAAADDGTTVNSIRKWMGDFRNVHPVAKLAARLGQSFSTSTKGIKLESHQKREISDFKQWETTFRHVREYCFTDGIGIISKSFVTRLAQEINLPESVCPSAFQIRCGGFKGMVCVDVANKITENNTCVYFRESMRKFIANDFSIDVVRTSLNPAVAYLNRQIILLLSSLGIPDQTFLSLQNDMLTKLKALTGDSEQACEALKALNEFGNHGCHAFLIAYIKSLGKARDPFVRQLLFAFEAFLIKQLRTKSKIHVPNSWCLLGVIDETRTLNYGEVFIQIDNTHQQKDDSVQEIIKGPVIVTRNPCFHPGDIRRLQAVDIPALHELKNVVVFPMQGTRPHPTEMSGGDLDGDTFWISRHPDLVFSVNEEPFDYQEQQDEANQDTQLLFNVQHTIEDVCNFFGEYIAADNLGIIANSHLAFADQLVHGAKNDICLKLARMHSVAVDFAKNGVNAPRLTRDLRPSKYPHFMEKKDKTSYDSKTVLGILYDEVKDHDTTLHVYQEREISATSSFPYRSFFINGSGQYTEEARIIKNDYDRDLKRFMRQYGIKHEAEVVSGCILEFTAKQYAKETKLFDLINEIRHTYTVIQEKYLHLFWQEFYQVTDKSEDEQVKWSEVAKKLRWKNQLTLFEFYDKTTLLEEVKKKASAWFHVTYEPWIIYIKNYHRNQNQKSNNFTNIEIIEETKRFKELFSFAWIVYPVLLEIFDENKKLAQPKKKRKKKHNKKDNNQVQSKTTDV